MCTLSTHAHFKFIVHSFYVHKEFHYKHSLYNMLWFYLHTAHNTENSIQTVQTTYARLCSVSYFLNIYIKHAKCSKFMGIPSSIPSLYNAQIHVQIIIITMICLSILPI